MSELFTRFGVLCAGAMLATLLVAGAWYRRQGVGYGVWIRLCVMAIPLAWLASRLVYCLANIPYYFIEVENPALMLQFRDGGFSLFGAMGGLVLAAWLTAKWQRISPAVLLDGIGLGAPLGIIIERLAQIGTGVGWGDAIESEWLLPIGVTESYWHPVYLYQAICAAILLLILAVWLVIRKGRMGQIRGDLFLVFLTLYGAMQVVLESLCSDGHMVVHHFVHINQIVAIVLPVAALAVWSARLAKKGAKKSQLVIVWLIVAAMIGLGIRQEFAVDHPTFPLVVEYGIMAAAMAVVAATALIVRRKANS